MADHLRLFDPPVNTAPPEFGLTCRIPRPAILYKPYTRDGHSDPSWLHL